MKHSHIAFVVVAAICAVGAAQAAPQTIWSSGVSPFPFGPTPIQVGTRIQFEAFRSNCFGGTVHVYMNPNIVNGDSLPGDPGTGNFFAYQCIFNPAMIDAGMAGTYGGQSVTLFHTVEGGSFMAFAPYLPVGNPNRITNLRRITAAASTGCTTNFPFSPFTGATAHAGCAISDPAIEPDGGFSDVEDEFWPQLTLGTNFVTASANVAQLFGVVVTEELYKAMQTKQKADLLLPATCVVGDFTAGFCQPSISVDQYRSIASNGSAGAWQTDWQPLVGAAGTGKVVNLCRRVQTSGTQASSNAFFLENPCRQWPTLSGVLAPSIAANSTATYIVTEAASTGSVKVCLNNSNNHINPNNRFAIGVLSMENIPVATFEKFKYVKLGGASGNLDARQRAAGAKGTYPFVMEMVYTVHVPARQTFFDELANDLGDPVLVAPTTGLFVLPTAPNAGVPDGDKVGFGTKFGNNCQPQQLFF